MIVATEATPRQSPSPVPAPEAQLAGRWQVVVLNDPVNGMSYVVMVLRRVFGFEEPRARRHMLEAHESGRTVVWIGTREQAGNRLGRQGRDRLVGDGRDLRLVMGHEVDEDRELLVGAGGKGALGGEHGDFGIDVAPDEALEQRHGGHGSGVPGSGSS